MSQQQQQQEDKVEFLRKPSQFRNWIKVGSEEFPPEKDRYHLYISLACPWANRTLIVLRLKGLEDVISVSITEPKLYEDGWHFNPDFDSITTIDHVNHCKTIPEVYRLANKDYQGRFSVPVLWDKKNKTIVNNESSEIIRMFNFEFNEFAKNPTLNLVPKDKEKEIDRINEIVYENINNGVYKCGFAPSQQGYDKAFDSLFETLDQVEEILSKSRYLVGDVLTEADIRLYPTLVRFDCAYVNIFKCNKKMIKEYPNLFNYLKELYQIPILHASTNIAHIKNGYFGILKYNPSGIIPRGPSTDNLNEPHDRDVKFPLKK